MLSAPWRGVTSLAHERIALDRSQRSAMVSMLNDCNLTRRLGRTRRFRRRRSGTGLMDNASLLRGMLAHLGAHIAQAFGDQKVDRTWLFDGARPNPSQNLDAVIDRID